MRLKEVDEGAKVINTVLSSHCGKDLNRLALNARKALLHRSHFVQGYEEMNILVDAGVFEPFPEQLLRNKVKPQHVPRCKGDSSFQDEAWSLLEEQQ